MRPVFRTRKGSRNRGWNAVFLGYTKLQYNRRYPHRLVWDLKNIHSPILASRLQKSSPRRHCPSNLLFGSNFLVIRDFSINLGTVRRSRYFPGRYGLGIQGSVRCHGKLCRKMASSRARQAKAASTFSPMAHPTTR